MNPGSPPAWPPLVLLVVGVEEAEAEEEGAAPAAVTWLRFRRALRCWLRLLLLTICYLLLVCVCLGLWLNVGRSLCLKILNNLCVCGPKAGGRSGSSSISVLDVWVGKAGIISERCDGVGFKV